MKKIRYHFFVGMLLIFCVILGGCQSSKTEQTVSPSAIPSTKSDTTVSTSGVSASAVSDAAKSKLPLDDFIGAWHCQDSPKENSDVYTGYMNLDIMPDGTFSIYDVEAGNPCISGTIAVDSKTDVTFNSNPSAEFDPPATWDKISHTQKLSYKFESKKKLLLTFSDGSSSSTLIFKREKQE